MSSPRKIKHDARMASYERWKDIPKKWGKSAGAINKTQRIAYILKQAWKLAFDIAVRTMTIEEAQNEAWMKVGGSVKIMIENDYGLPNICDTAPYPKCNGANGCDTCEHQPEE